MLGCSSLYIIDSGPLWPWILFGPHVSHLVSPWYTTIWWLNNWPANWTGCQVSLMTGLWQLTDWLAAALANWLTDSLTHWLTDQLTGWLTGLLIDWVTFFFNAGLLNDHLTYELSVWLTDWLTDWLTYWLTNWLARLTKRLTYHYDWLTDYPRIFEFTVHSLYSMCVCIYVYSIIICEWKYSL